MNEKECREIYREAFRDPDDQFENRLFSLCGEYCRTLMRDGRTAAMLFALPCRITGGKKTASGFYIYAAATKREYRGTGCMSRLIETLKQEGSPLFLKPADDGLIKFYEKLGFKAFAASASDKGGCRACPEGGFAKLVSEEPPADHSYTAMSFGADDFELDNMYFPYIME